MVQRTARRPLGWFDYSAENQTLTSNTQVAVITSSDMTDADKRGGTVTRLLVTVHIRPSLINLGQMVTYGMALVHEDQTNYPDPQVSTDQPGWLFKDQIRVIMSDLEDGSQIRRQMYDIRSQRKFRGPSDLVRFIIFNNAGGGSSIVWDVFIRMLCRLG